MRNRTASALSSTSEWNMSHMHRHGISTNPAESMEWQNLNISLRITPKGRALYTAPTEGHVVPKATAFALILRQDTAPAREALLHTRGFSWARFIPDHQCHIVISCSVSAVGGPTRVHTEIEFIPPLQVKRPRSTPTQPVPEFGSRERLLHGPTEYGSKVRVAVASKKGESRSLITPS